MGLEDNRTLITEFMLRMMACYAREMRHLMGGQISRFYSDRAKYRDSNQAY
jgi:hypothetical protein